MHYGELKKCDIANGIGVRVTLFVSGCTNHCKNCFQPQTWDFCYGQPFTAETEQYLLELLAPYVKVGGYVAALKGAAAQEELDECKNAIKLLGLRTESVTHFDVDGADHAVILLKKIAPTPARFPRRYAKIKQSPL